MTAPNTRSRRQMLKLIRARGEISRAELARLTGLTRPTVSSAVSELLAGGLVMETGKGNSSGGKRPIMLKLRSEAALSIGIDLADEYRIRGVLCDLGGQVVLRQDVPYSNNFESIRDALRRITALLWRENIRGIGIAVSGLVDDARREIVSSTNFDIAGRNLGATLQDKFNVPVLLENRPNAAALAEKMSGAGTPFRNFVYVTSGRGVGAGIIIDGKVFRGSTGSAGEIGRMPMPFEPEPEFEGTSHALEDLTRDSALVAMIARAKGRPLDYRETLELYRRGDPDAVRIFRKNAMFLAHAMQTVSDILNPEAVILGGRAPELGEPYLNDFKEHFYRGAATQNTQILYSMFGREGSARGAATAILDKVFNFTI